jgi:hypothetical protein
MVAGSDMETPIATGHAFLKLAGIIQIAFNGFKRDTAQSAQIAVWPEESADLMTASHQFMYEIAADETRGACDETEHPRNIGEKGEGRKENAMEKLQNSSSKHQRSTKLQTSYIPSIK